MGKRRRAMPGSFRPRDCGVEVEHGMRQRTHYNSRRGMHTSTAATGGLAAVRRRGLGFFGRIGRHAQLFHWRWNGGDAVMPVLMAGRLNLGIRHRLGYGLAGVSYLLGML